MRNSSTEGVLRFSYGLATSGQIGGVGTEGIEFRIAESPDWKGARVVLRVNEKVTVTKIAEDRAEQLTREPDKVAHEIEKRIRTDVRQAGDFRRVHPLPLSSQDVPDETDACLVVLSIDHPYTKDPSSAALVEAKSILEMRGNTPRLFRNALVFLAVDQSRLQDLDEAVRRFLAWDSIVAESETLDLSPNQVKQAENQRTSADTAVTARLPEAYQWLLVPVQKSPQENIEWQAFRLSGQEGLAVRASKELRKRDLLLAVMAGSVLRMELDKVPLWRGEHVAIKQLVDDFARYVYLPRLAESQVLLDGIADGLSLLTWEHDTFAYADSHDEVQGRYRGLRGGTRMILDSSTGLLVKPEAARRQMDAEAPKEAPVGVGTVPLAPNGGDADTPTRAVVATATVPALNVAARPNRFHASLTLDPTRVGRDAGRVADEVISHLSGLMNSNVTVTLEIQADIPGGVPEKVVRTVTENCRTLKFQNHGFEES